MRKVLVCFLILVSVSLNAFCAIGTGNRGDKRRVIGWIGDRPSYVPESTKNIWNEYPYCTIVYISTSSGTGTGEFISPRHILTNAHIAAECGMKGRPVCTIYTARGILYAKTVFYGNTRSGVLNNWNSWEGKKSDWQILEITDPNYCGELGWLGFEGQNGSKTGLWRAGFGALRVLSEKDVQNIRAAYSYFLRNGGTGELKDFQDKQPFLDEFKRLSGGKDFVRDYLNDYATLKLVTNCKIESINAGGVFSHTCDMWHGDSGSSIQGTDNYVIGIGNAGLDYIGKDAEYPLNTGIMTYFRQNPTILQALKDARLKCEKN